MLAMLIVSYSGPPYSFLEHLSHIYLSIFNNLIETPTHHEHHALYVHFILSRASVFSSRVSMLVFFYALFFSGY